MSSDDSKLVIRFEQLQRDVTTIKSWRIENSYMVSTDGWEAVIYDTDRAKLFDLELQPVELILHGNSQLLGRVDRTEIGSDGSAVTLNGRDYLADLVECNVDPSLKISAGDPLFVAITSAGFPVGIDSVVSDDDVAMREVRSGKSIAVKAKGRGHRRKSAKLDDYKPKPGEGIYEYVNRLVARFGCTIQPGPDRQTLVLCAPRYDQEPAYSITRTDDPTKSAHNIVTAATAVRDFSKFPTYTMVTGQHVGDSGSAVNASQHYDMFTLAQEFNDELGRILLETIITGRRKPGESGQAATLGFDQLYRLCTFRDAESRTQEQLTNAAKRVIADRLKDTLLYTVTLKGHTDPKSGAVWAVDTMVQIDDAICNVHEPLWIASRVLEYSAAGATTQLTCIRPNSYQIGSDL